MNKFDANVVAHFPTLKTLREPALGWRLEEPDPRALVCCAGDDGVKLLSNLSR